MGRVSWDEIFKKLLNVNEETEKKSAQKNWQRKCSMQTIYQEEVEESSKKSFLGREKIKINGQKSSIIIANR